MRVEGPLAWRDPPRYEKEGEEAFSARKAALRAKHIDAVASAKQRNAGNLQACLNAARWLDDAGDHAAANAVREHIRRQWGRCAVAEAA